MIESFSPVSRRAIALTIGLLAILLIVQLILLPVIDRMTASRDALADSRFELQRLEAVSQRPPVPEIDKLPAGIFIEAKNAEQAGKILLARIVNMSASSGLAVGDQSLITDLGLASQVGAKVTVSGPEASVISFLAELENGRPVIRARSWQIETFEDRPGEIRLNARLRAAWQVGA